MTNIDTTRPVRTPRTTCTPSQAQTQARRNAVAGTLELVPADSASDGSQRTAVFLQATVDLDLAGLSLSVTSASDGQLRFTASDQAPSIIAGIAGSLSLAWLNGWSAHSGQRVLLGYVEAPRASSLAIQAVSANAASDGGEITLNCGAPLRRQ